MFADFPKYVVRIRVPHEHDGYRLFSRTRRITVDTTRESNLSHVLSILSIPIIRKKPSGCLEWVYNSMNFNSVWFLGYHKHLVSYNSMKIYHRPMRTSLKIWIEVQSIVFKFSKSRAARSAVRDLSVVRPVRAFIF